MLQPNPEYRQAAPEARPLGLIIQFTEDFLQKPEVQALNGLFARARRGLQFSDAGEVLALLNHMPPQPDSRKLLTLLEVLLQLAKTEHYRYLTTQDYYFDYSRDEERMWRINQYLYTHFAEKITIQDVANVATMSETAFCRYFKTRTLKNFTQYLNEIRVAYACKLLQKPNYSVTAACFEAGFNNLSYFNRQFRGIVGMNPQAYRKRKLGSEGL